MKVAAFNCSLTFSLGSLDIANIWNHFCSFPGMVVARGNCLPACPPWVSSAAPLGDLLQCLQNREKILRGVKRREGGRKRVGRRREGVFHVCSLGQVMQGRDLAQLFICDPQNKNQLE